MKMVVVSIKDTAADAFGRPAFVASEGVAVRQFQDEVNRNSMIISYISILMIFICII